LTLLFTYRQTLSQRRQDLIATVAGRDGRDHSHPEAQKCGHCRVFADNLDGRVDKLDFLLGQWYQLQVVR
jgi:hypothetical protein